MLQHDKIWEWG